MNVQDFLKITEVISIHMIVLLPAAQIKTRPFLIVIPRDFSNAVRQKSVSLFKKNQARDPQ